MRIDIDEETAHNAIECARLLDEQGTLGDAYERGELPGAEYSERWDALEKRRQDLARLVLSAVQLAAKRAGG